MKSTKCEKIVHLFISLPTEDVCSLRDIDTTMSVDQLKSKVELKVGLPGDLIHLFYMNNELDDKKQLSEYKLKHGCILRIRLHKTWLGLFMSCWKGDLYEVFNNGVQEIDFEVQGLDVGLWNKLVIKRATFALFIAAHRGYLSLILELLNSSAADVNGFSKYGRTCLHVAAYQGFVGCVSLLLSEGALSNLQDVFGNTALQLAAINRHIYCQKKIYLHQTSGGNESILSRKNAEEPESGIGTPSKRLLKHRKSLPKISVSDHHNASFPPPPPNSTKESEPYVSPQVKVDQDSKNHDSDDGSPQEKLAYELKIHHSEEDVPDTKPSKDQEKRNEKSEDQLDLSHEDHNGHATLEIEKTTPLSQLKYTENHERPIPRNIHGIEKILKTSQDDLVGEYHNIKESLADVKVTTLMVTMPSDNTGQPGFPSDVTKENDSDENQHQNIVEPVTRTPIKNKKILGFVLKAEQTSHQMESAHEQCEDKIKTCGNDPDHLTWDPSLSTGTYHRKLTSALSYDEWLQKKKESERLGTNKRPSSATTRRSGREIDDEAFQKWLNNKKKFRRRRASLSSVSDIKSSTGASFEMWLNEKRQLYQSSEKEIVSEKSPQRAKTANFVGKTFEEWLSEKSKKWSNDGMENPENKPTRSRSGKTFREWLKDKRKDKEKENIDREISELKKLQVKELFEEQRSRNPRVKTFQEWEEEKRTQKLIESVRSKNAPGPSLLHSDEKFQEDADLVFQIWLTSKNMEELSKEKDMYEEMKEKWRKKEQERLQIRNAGRKLNQLQ